MANIGFKNKKANNQKIKPLPKKKDSNIKEQEWLVFREWDDDTDNNSNLRRSNHADCEFHAVDHVSILLGQSTSPDIQQSPKEEKKKNDCNEVWQKRTQKRNVISKRCEDISKKNIFSTEGLDSHGFLALEGSCDDAKWVSFS